MFDTHVDLMPIVMLLAQYLVIPLGLYGIHLGFAIAEKKLEPWLGPQRALALQRHFDRVAEAGLGSAASKYLGDLQTKGLTVDVGNTLTAHAATYMMTYAPGLAESVKTAEGSIEQRIDARLLTSPSVGECPSAPAGRPRRRRAPDGPSPRHPARPCW